MCIGEALPWAAAGVAVGGAGPQCRVCVRGSRLLCSSQLVVGARSAERALPLFSGDGWSARLEDAVLHGCIPVIIIDNVHVVFESILVRRARRFLCGGATSH